jgi:hypothetical protein
MQDVLQVVIIPFVEAPLFHYVENSAHETRPTVGSVVHQKSGRVLCITGKNASNPYIIETLASLDAT